MKKINFEQLVTDLGLNRPFVKGQTIPINNCWHFSTDGNAIDCLFYDDGDFIAGMNRIYITVRGYNVIILAFSLMDTHVHFVLYGEFDECLSLKKVDSQMLKTNAILLFEQARAVLRQSDASLL